jgi:hypothetical protein
MPKIDNFQPGKIIISEKSYTHDILILVDGTVKRRDDVFLNFVSHTVKQAEIAELLKGYPEVIVIGMGTEEKVGLSFNVGRLVAELKADLIALPSPKAVTRYNQLLDEGKRVAALIHITD